MRRSAAPRPCTLLALTAGLLVAGCSVNVDGAPCKTRGDAFECPDGQACGNDFRCSARALACVDSRCTPGVGGECLDPSGVTSGVDLAKRCTDGDPVCGSWTIEPCTANGFRCGSTSGGARCECPPTATHELTVRPDGSPDAGAPPYPTGAASPPACGLRRLSDALVAAAAIAADPTAAATVTAVGAAAGGTRTFSSATTGEVFPLAVGERVALTSDAAASGGSYEIVFDAEGAAIAPVELHAGGHLSGFTVRNANGDATRDAIALHCDGGPDPAVLTSVVLEGAGAAGARLGHGLVVNGTCGVVATDVQVRDMSVAGVVLDSPAAGAQVAFTGGTIQGCGDGVRVRNGRLLVDGVLVKENAGMGIRADDPGGIPRIEIRRSKVVRNGDTGIALRSATEVRVTGATVFGNGAAWDWGGPSVPSQVFRRAGGLVLWGNPPAAGSFEFGKNRIYANGGDQVLALGTDPASTWTLDGPAGCGSDASGPLFSVVGCYDPTSADTTLTYRGVVALDAKVSVQNVAWQSVTPSASVDFAAIGNGAIMNVSPPCWDPTLVCSTEDPAPP